MRRSPLTGVTTLLGSRLQEAGFVKNPSVTIGDNIRELLEKADISPDRLSKLSGVKKSVVHGILSNSCGISHSDVKKLAAVLPDLKKFETSYRIRQDEQEFQGPLSEREAIEIVRSPKLLRKHMRAFNISEERLSEKSGIRRDLVQEIMAGNKPVYPNTVKKVAQALIDMDSMQKILGPLARETSVGTLTEAIGEPEYIALTAGLSPPEAPKTDEIETSSDQLLSLPEPEKPEPEESVKGLQLDSYVSELTAYFRDDDDEDKVTSAIKALGMIADASLRFEFTRDELLGKLAPKNWQRLFIKRIKLAGYLEQIGEKRNTRYVTTGLIMTNTPSVREVVEMIWPGRVHPIDESDAEQSELDEEVENQVQSGFPEGTKELQEDGVTNTVFPGPSPLAAPKFSGVHGLEDILMAMKAMFFEALKGQLEVIVSHGSQLDRIERKLDVTLRELGVDPESI